MSCPWAQAGVALSCIEPRHQVRLRFTSLLQVRFSQRLCVESAYRALLRIQVRVRARRGTEAGPATRGQTPVGLFFPCPY